jgi:hypothetical protein
MIFLETYNPNPVPEKDLVVNFENNFGTISGSIPEPLSFMLTTTFLLPSSSLLLSSVLYYTEMFKVPLSCGVNLIALSIKLLIT